MPDSILLKPGRLDPEEYAVIQTHAVLGARVLADSRSDIFEVAEQVVRSHHERWDGTGYPDGLAEAAIPIVARVVHLADVFDVLLHERPYKEAWTVDQAVAEIRAGSGTQFDPDVVAAFEALGPAPGPPDLCPSERARIQDHAACGDDHSRWHGRHASWARWSRSPSWAAAVRLSSPSPRRPRPPLPARRTPTSSRRPTAASGPRPRRPVTAPSRSSRPAGARTSAPRDEPEDRVGVGAAASCTAPELDPVGGSLPAVLASTLCLLNAERVDRGLARLSENGRLATAARRYAGDLVAGALLLPHRP